MRFTSPVITGAIRAAYQNRLVSQVTKLKCIFKNDVQKQKLKRRGKQTNRNKFLVVSVTILAKSKPLKRVAVRSYLLH